MRGMRSSTAGCSEPWPATFVLRFFVTCNGEIRCRITDVRSSQSWTCSDTHQLRTLLSAITREKASPNRD
jgi:hypothetical protein